MAYHFAVVGKFYFDGELIKQCLIIVVKYIHSGKVTDYSSNFLLCVTTQHRQDNIAKQLSLSLQTKINKEVSLFSLVVNQSTDINDSLQLLVFICSLSQALSKNIHHW